MKNRIGTLSCKISGRDCTRAFGAFFKALNLYIILKGLSILKILKAFKVFKELPFKGRKEKRAATTTKKSNMFQPTRK